MNIEVRFFDTYNLCANVDGLLKNQFDYLLQLEGFHCDGQWADWLAPYQRFSVFHRFIDYVIQGTHADDADAVDLGHRIGIMESFANIPSAIEDLRPRKLPIEEAFIRHGIDHQSFVEFLSDAGKVFAQADDNDVYDYMNEVRLTGSYELLMEQTVAEVFHVLFQNRQLLLTFNDYISRILENAKHDEAEDLDRSLLAQNGTLLRVKPPKWAQRAVYFRDRGRCVLCGKDLSGLLNLGNIENYDHIVPLARFGLNDVTNLQLLCEHCNQVEKRDGGAVTSSRYQTWYSDDDD